MTQERKAVIGVSVCSYCGEKGGIHIWAGTGHCPGLDQDKDAEIEPLKALCARAADALESCHSTHQTGYGWLIAELRKAV